MFTHRIKTVASTMIGAAAIGLVALGTAGTAAATTADDAFISQMDNLGISFSSPPKRSGKATRCAGSWLPARPGPTSPPKSSSRPT